MDRHEINRMDLQDSQYIPTSDKSIKKQIWLCIIAIVICVGMVLSQIISESIKIPRDRYDSGYVMYILLTTDYRTLFNFINIILFILIQAGIYKYLSKTGAGRIKNILLALIVLSALLALSNQFSVSGSKFIDVKRIIQYTLEPCVLVLYLITGILMIRYKNDHSGGLAILGTGFITKAIVLISSILLTIYLQVELSEIKKLYEDDIYSYDNLLKLKYTMDASKEFLKLAMPASDIVILVYIIYLYLITGSRSKTINQ